MLVNEDEQAQYYEALKATLQPPVNNIISQYDWVTYYYYNSKIFYFYLFINYFNYVLRNGEQNYNNVPNDEELESQDNKNNVKGKIIKCLIFLIKFY